MQSPVQDQVMMINTRSQRAAELNLDFGEYQMDDELPIKNLYDENF